MYGGYNLNKVMGSLQIYRFATSTWENELGKKLNAQYTATEVNADLLQALLRNDNIDAGYYGIRPETSFFRSLLYSISDTTVRRQRDLNYNNKMISTENPVNITLPGARYGHAACRYLDGFLIFGGKLRNGNLANDLWFYNVTAKSWTQRAIHSKIKPPPVTRHTLTLAVNTLYLFGGSTEEGEFSSKLFKIKMKDMNGDEEWHAVIPRGGKTLDVRVVAHTTSYHRGTNSLIVYGGVVAGVARFSKLSDRMFSFQLEMRHWTEIMYPRTPLRDAYIPRERAFHTTSLIGNYLIVFGGYSHRHNKEEICYDNQMYLYHLGCHTWINQDVLGTNQKSNYPKQQGVFAHAADIRQGNTLLIVGGYHGNVNGDLLAYTLPSMLVMTNEDTYEPEAMCIKHASVTECLSDPECGWCSADSVCYGRTIGANCTTNLQTTRCPGICASLGDCHSCLIHGSTNTTNSYRSIAIKLGLGQCTWCVQNARCHHKDDNYGVCGEDTPSSDPGWWGTKGTEIAYAEKCTELDRRPGLTFLKYLHPVNWTMPDHVTIVNATMVDFNIPTAAANHAEAFNGEMVARLIGYIRPPRTWDNAGEMLRVCTSYSSAILKVTTEDTLQNSKLVVNISAEQTLCTLAQWPNLDSTQLLVDFQAKRTLSTGSQNNHHHHHQQSKMGLQHNRSLENPKAFTFEYLEPYSHGNCSTYKNCLHCLSDAICGWCELNNKCVSRLNDEMISCTAHNDWQYLRLQPSHCSNCSNFISCEKCIDSNLCEWWTEDARCARKGRSPEAVHDIEQCPAPCYTRKNCSSCLNEKGRCVWCEATSQCFSFSVYTSEYQFGLCREWLDQAIPMMASTPQQEIGSAHIQPIQQCKSCASHLNCTSCLRSLSCGWCYDNSNPIEGICMHGDFNSSTVNCSTALNKRPEEAKWAYAQCPDVDECGLNLHDCHSDAKCTNTDGSYSCLCKKGFIGDGRISCVRTCFETCQNGRCSDAPNYTCTCDLGWNGTDCSSDCGCNNHSTCITGIGVCDECQNWTEGEHCERCKPGSYGNATSAVGCKQCDCNKHGNQELGICDRVTGECYCQDNTEGLRCEMCNINFYGDPVNGGQCYYQCVARGVLTYSGKQGLGSYQSYKSQWGGIETRECLWIISPQTTSGVSLNDSLIQLEIEREDMNVSCGENAVYVYDGLPDLTGVSQQKQLMSVFCSEDTYPWTVESRSGHMTVHFKQGTPSRGFNAMYNVMSCQLGTCLPPYICDKNNKCVCPNEMVGLKCSTDKCPSNCTSSLNQGVCDANYGRCLCSDGWGGVDCSQKIRSSNIVFTELFNSQLLSGDLEHLRKTLPRFGHSLVADRRGSLWMFGGYSLSHGHLNDIRQYDTKNNTWLQVTVDSTPEAKMPEGRYFHAAEIVPSKQSIYIYGGLAGQGRNKVINILDDFWQFHIQSQRWSEVKVASIRPPALTGHTLTLLKESDRESLVMIGGFSFESGVQNSIWEYTIETNKWDKLSASGAAPAGLFGHSTVYHAPTQILYIFGGYEYIGNQTVMSNKLYALSYPKMVWSELPPFDELNRPNENLPRKRFLHSAVTTENYMIIFGGRSLPHNSSDLLIAYVFKCNQWVRLTEDVEVIGNIPSSTYAQAMTEDAENDAIYVVGGWDGSTQSRVLKMNIPTDLCELWSKGKYLCRHFMGCSFCAVKPKEDHASHCFSNGKSAVCDGHNGTLVFNHGAVCDDSWISKRNCSSFETCTSCLASWPSHTETTPICQWCTADENPKLMGRCVSMESEKENKCGTVKQLPLSAVEECPALTCVATDCDSCNMQDTCTWVRTATKSYDCLLKTVAEKQKAEVIDSCPAKCVSYRNCSSCLAAASSEGGWEECRWSTQLNECISPTYQPLYCSGGVCGLVLESTEAEHCPEPCHAFNQCSSCLRHAHCGWCSKDNADGVGICTEGSLESPSENPATATCDVIYRSRMNNTNVTDTTADKFSWNYVKCPPENECNNSHHNCNPKSERCVDQKFGYECQCAVGYKLNQNNQCVPVCTQGCVRGVCVEPNVCKCNFGYVGANCSIQCECNGHSDCTGPDKLKECTKCHNNTMGDQCEKCLPLFVGDPRDNGDCIPCFEYCNRHTDVCETKMDDLSQATCIKCDNRTAGERCETCITGNFRGTAILTDGENC